MKHSARQGRVGMYQQLSPKAQSYRLAMLIVIKRERKRTQKNWQEEGPGTKGTIRGFLSTWLLTARPQASPHSGVWRLA